MGRIKLNQTKDRLNLSVTKEAVDRGKEVANFENKSLSQLTEDIYNKMYDNYKGFSKDPEKAIENLIKEVENIKKIILTKKNVPSQKIDTSKKNERGCND